MLLAEYLNGQFSLLQNLDFILRITVACLCGALIGFERSKRYKEAGIRTHIIVCFAAALMMIVSKYGFADLTTPEGVIFNGTRGADPARIAAQVVSGISFLGAGVIFKHGSSIRGLTTAAGLWATAGIGLAIGAGMYAVGVFSTILVAILQIVMHKIVVGADSLVTMHIRFTVRNSEPLQRTIGKYSTEHRQQISECSVKYSEDGFVSYDAIMRTNREITLRELELFLREYGDIRDIGLLNLG